jgi:hypothetical protein
MTKRFDPAAPLRPQPTFPANDGTREDLIAELSTLGLCEGDVRHKRNAETDSANFEVGTWLIESLSHDHHRSEVASNAYGPRLTEALTILGSIQTQPVVTLSITTTTTISELIRTHEISLETAFNELVTCAHHLGLTVTVEISHGDPTCNTAVAFPPHQTLT